MGVRTELIAVGTELLLGQITDTNAPYLASELPLLGIDLYWISQVGDNHNRLVGALKRACERSDRKRRPSSSRHGSSWRDRVDNG